MDVVTDQSQCDVVTYTDRIDNHRAGEEIVVGEITRV